MCVCVLQTHSNETIGSIRWKISEHLSCPVDNVQIFANDSVVSVNDSVFLFMLQNILHLSSPHGSILLLSQSCVSPEASTQINQCSVNPCRRGATSSLVRSICCVAGETQPRTTSSIPVFFSHSVPSLLLHRVLVDHEPGPEAAVPARLQRRAEPDCEELGHRHSLWQLRVLGLRLQQLQLCRLQLCLRLGAGTRSDMTHKSVVTLGLISALTQCFSVSRRSPCPVW